MFTKANLNNQLIRTGVVQYALEQAAGWFTANKLKINEEKTQSLLCSLRAGVGEDSVKLLGFWLDGRLSWHHHIDKKQSAFHRTLIFINSHSLSILLLVTCMLVLLLVANSHKLQAPQQIRSRLLRDMFGLDNSALRNWLTPNSSIHQPEFVLR